MKATTTGQCNEGLKILSKAVMIEITDCDDNVVVIELDDKNERFKSYSKHFIEVLTLDLKNKINSLKNEKKDGNT